MLEFYGSLRSETIGYFCETLTFSPLPGVQFWRYFHTGRQLKGRCCVVGKRDRYPSIIRLACDCYFGYSLSRNSLKFEYSMSHAQAFTKQISGCQCKTLAPHLRDSRIPYFGDFVKDSLYLFM